VDQGEGREVVVAVCGGLLGTNSAMARGVPKLVLGYCSSFISFSYLSLHFEVAAELTFGKFSSLFFFKP